MVSAARSNASQELVVLDPQAADALRLFQRFASSGRVGITEKALTEFRLAYGREASISDVWDAVCAAAATDVHKVEPDHNREERTVIVLRLPVLGRLAYVKATMRLGGDESVALLSCKRWGP